LAGGESLPAVARRYKVSPDALRRHRAAHLTPALVKVAVERYGAETAASAFESVVGRLEGLVDRLEGLLTVAEDRKSLMGAANLAREIRSSLELIARLRGELDTRPITATVNILATPEFTGVVSRLIAALAPYPEARLAAAQVLDVEEVP
jgi:peptide subunit release factor RF-3